VSEQAPARLVESSDANAVFTATEWIMSIPLMNKFAPKAIGVCTGLGETERVLHALYKWATYPASTWLFISGTYENERTFPNLTLEKLHKSPYSVDKEYANNVLTQVRAKNTPEQAKWLVAQAYDKNVRSMELHAPPYHIVRAYLTVLKAMDQSRRFLLVPHATPLPPDHIVPEYADKGTRAFEMAAGEYERIVKYQKTGDVATLEELSDYLAWMWQQPDFNQFGMR
jgi:hypothetical protein